MIYFDNAATSYYKPKSVIDAVNDTLTNYSFNAHRSAHALANALSLKIEQTREKVAKLCGAKSAENVIFCSNCTHALNLAILGSLEKKDHVITTVMEHNSVLRPLYMLESKGLIDVTLLTPNTEGKITANQVLNAINSKTKMVVISHVSNVTGYTQDISSIGQVLKDKKIIFLVDGAQSIGYLPINIGEFNVDMLAFPAHKGLHGTQGLGCLVIGDKFLPNPIMYGGTGSVSFDLNQPTFLPDRYEAGTLNSPAIVGLNYAIDWWNNNSHEFLPKIKHLQNFLSNALSQIKNVKVYSKYNDSGIVTFEVIDRDSNEIADILASKYDIAVRSGIHCAPLIHKYLNTEKTV